jgi:hypothetical protein
MTPKDALKEIFDLLEDYAPAWYTEEHRNHIAMALQESDDTHWRPGTRDQEMTNTAESSIKKKLSRKTPRPILAAVTSRRPVKPEGGPSPR